MANPRFYCPMPLPAEGLLTLPETVARHAVGALRLNDGDALTLFNGDGREHHGVLVRQGKHAQAHLIGVHPVDRESPLDITLVQGISTGERMDYTLQKSVELGIRHILPVMMLRTVVRLDPDKRHKRRLHWQGVAASACEQCGRNRLPEVLEIDDFSAWLARSRHDDNLRLILDPMASLRLGQLPAPDKPVYLIAGPEGGLDPRERDAAIVAGCTPVSLGPRILRTETAAVAALALMQGLWGDL
jgi:16S rRNA (uracil1498-N3)-methyltransferase